MDDERVSSPGTRVDAPTSPVDGAPLRSRAIYRPAVVARRRRCMDDRRVIAGIAGE